MVACRSAMDVPGRIKQRCETLQCDGANDCEANNVQPTMEGLGIDRGGVQTAVG